MIVFLKTYTTSKNGDAMPRKLATYLRKHAKSAPGDFKGLWWQTGRRPLPNRRDLELMESAYLQSGKMQMIVFSPVLVQRADILAEKTRQTMYNFFKKENTMGARFLYALHYNTDHPHTHVLLFSPFMDDFINNMDEEYALRDVAAEEFVEPMGTMAYDFINKTEGTRAKWDDAAVDSLRRSHNVIRQTLAKEEQEIEETKPLSLDELYDMEMGMW